MHGVSDFFFFVTCTYLLDSWASQRQVFGKPLNAQPVVRSKLAAMIARVECLQAWLENVTYQMNNMVDSISLNLVHVMILISYGPSRMNSRLPN